MISKIVCNIKNNSSVEKLVVRLTTYRNILHINWSIRKRFPIETLLKMIDSSVRSLGEVEYDNQNGLQH
jgi:hypothetical protein